VGGKSVQLGIKLTEPFLRDPRELSISIE